MEELIELAKVDDIVNFEYLVNNKIHTFSAIPKRNIKTIVIYCHGLGSNKNWAVRFYKKLTDHDIGIIAFDFPGHGEDKTHFSKFSLSLCLNYLNDIIKYVKKTYNASICLFGCSFGGFVILNKLIYDQECAYKTILMCPAINFSEILEKKANISIEYYNSNLYMPLYNNIKIYKKAYLEFKNGTEKIKNGHFENIAIIQGFADKTVLCENVKKFCKDKRIKLKIIKNGKHELYGFDKEIVEFLLKNLN